jgi:beta-glucosidase
VYYNHKPTAKRGYAFDKTDALFPFGFGLSYTQFSYSDFSIRNTDVKVGELVEISVKVTNTGERVGDEIVQLYLHDSVASLTRPVKELKGFKRISLKAKESAVVTFSLAVNQLGFYNRDMKYVVEPGKFDVMIGSSSQDIRAKGEFTVVGDVTDISKQKVYFSGVKVVKK